MLRVEESNRADPSAEAGSHERFSVSPEHIFWCGGTAGGTETSLNGIHVLVPDLRGAMPEDFDCELLLATLRCSEGVKDFCREHKQYFYEAWKAVQLIEKMDKKPVIIVGHSQGCIHALLVALLLNYRTAVICLAPPYTRASAKRLAVRAAVEWSDDLLARVSNTSGNYNKLAIAMERVARLRRGVNEESGTLKEKMLALNAETIQRLLVLCASDGAGRTRMMEHLLDQIKLFGHDEVVVMNYRRALQSVLMSTNQEGKVASVHMVHMRKDRVFPQKDTRRFWVDNFSQYMADYPHSTDNWVIDELDLHQIVQRIKNTTWINPRR